MLECKVVVTNTLGLHARAAAQLVRLAGNFESKIVIRRTDNQREANARSILNILAIAASKETILDVTVEGVDEAAAFDAVMKLFSSGFGEK